VSTPVPLSKDEEGGAEPVMLEASQVKQTAVGFDPPYSSPGVYTAGPEVRGRTVVRATESAVVTWGTTVAAAPLSPVPTYMAVIPNKVAATRDNLRFSVRV
jgi:hypothetical protein